MIKANNISLCYPINIEDGFSLKSVLSRANKPYVTSSYTAIDNVSFRIEKGEKVGLLGLNGSGKTTLLKIICKIFTPTSGSLHAEGLITPMLDFMTGFEEHHTGYENIKIRLMFLGLDEKEIDGLVDEIASFAELEEFLHLPSRTYSTGMFMRLAFATSTAIKPDILVADEVIGAGDAQFAEKIEQRLDSFLQNRQTLVMSSHSIDLLNKYCDRCIWLHKGRILEDGPTSEVVKKYTELAPSLSR